jgi:uroporphyrinogen-III synthase
VLFPRAAEGREVLVDGLAGRGWQVDVVEAYRTVWAPADESLRASIGAADAVCFSASSTVTGFLGAYGPGAVPPAVVCIGPVTADTARRSGLAVTAVASEASVAGLVDAVVAVLGRGQPEHRVAPGDGQ